MIKAPKGIEGIETFRVFVAELGGPKMVAQQLDVSERTVWNWLKREKAPRAAALALYWESRYGRSLIDSDQVNEIRLLYRHICILQEQYARARDIVQGLRRLNTGTANEAYFDELPDLSAAPPDTYSAMQSAALKLHVATSRRSRMG